LHHNPAPQDRRQEVQAPRRKRKFIFRRDPRDISVIWFYDPEVAIH
jgi:putative transposase